MRNSGLDARYDGSTISICQSAQTGSPRRSHDACAYRWNPVHTWKYPAPCRVRSCHGSGLFHYSPTSCRGVYFRSCSALEITTLRYLTRGYTLWERETSWVQVTVCNWPVVFYCLWDLGFLSLVKWSFFVIVFFCFTFLWLGNRELEFELNDHSLICNVPGSLIYLALLLSRDWSLSSYRFFTFRLL